MKEIGIEESALCYCRLESTHYSPAMSCSHALSTTTGRPCPAVMPSAQLQPGHVLQSCPLHNYSPAMSCSHALSTTTVMPSAELQPGHVLQSCPLHKEERVSTWPTESSLGEKLHVTATDLCLRVRFIIRTGPQIWQEHIERWRRKRTGGSTLFPIAISCCWLVFVYF